jgi:4-hydroxybenzoate polyprenyltransferase
MKVAHFAPDRVAVQLDWRVWTVATFVGRSGVGAAGAATCFLALCLRVYGRPLQSPLLVLGFTSTIVAYGIDRLADSARPKTRRRALALALAALLLAGWGLEGWFGAPRVLALSIFIQLAVIAYTLPVLPGDHPRVKDVPYAKNIYTAAGWALLAVLAAVAAPGARRAAILGMVVFIGGKVMVAAIAADLKDTAADREQGVRTFASEWGVDRTVTLARLLNTLCALTTVALVVAGALPKFLLMAEVSSLLVVVVLAWPRLRYDRRAAVTCAVLFELTLSMTWPLAELGRVLMGAR